MGIRMDMSIFRGEVPLSLVEYLCSLGHEWSGVVAKLGMNVWDPSLGTPAIAEGCIPCQRCATCRAGVTNLCSAQQQFGFNRPGGSAFVPTAVSTMGKRLAYDRAWVVARCAAVGFALVPAPVTALGIAWYAVIGIGFGAIKALIFALQADTVEYGEW